MSGDLTRVLCLSVIMGKFDALHAMFTTLMAFTSTEVEKGKRQYRSIMADVGAQISMNAALSIAGLIVAAVVSLNVLAALAPTWFSSTKSLGDNFTNADVGDATANSIANTVFPLIIGLLGVFAIAGLAFLVMKLRKS